MVNNLQSQKSTLNFSNMNPQTEDIKDRFCKHYAAIKLNCDAPFYERMQFDIYKRATKLERYNVLVESQKQKVPKEEAEKVFSRLHEDTQKRMEHRRRMSKPAVKEPSQRKMSQAETNTLYNEFMEKWKKSQEALEEKRRAKKQREEMEEAQYLAAQSGPGRRRAKGVSLVERMNSDIKQRKLRQEERVSEQEQKARDELKQMFIPRTNSYYRHLRKEKLNASLCTNGHCKRNDVPRLWPKKHDWQSPDSVEDCDNEDTVRCNNPELILGKFIE
eukprot:TRINITY_DN4372_c0_g1_i20.p1 TRINITY_DN4372_c0_g1~~TRINITY_DN4372_c0_g1_i20.p1  ORF type:complete len:274 (-),score=79.23 TRINITY_DN4372_c0_g1_i20:181-1002(-)